MDKKEFIINLAIALFFIVLVAVGVQLQLNANHYVQLEHPPLSNSSSNCYNDFNYSRDNQEKEA
jgi:hypothetical protein